ncbi:MAG TPA: spermidine/putrescine ABC transporter substrate-binding protein [Gaiellales bacterium]
MSVDTHLEPAAGMSRRALMQRAGALGLGLPAASLLLEACGGSSSGSSAPASSASGPPTGTAILNNYPGWIGKHNIADFEAKYPGAHIKMVTSASSSNAEVVLQMKSGEFDMMLADATDDGQASAAGLVAPLDWSKIPNIKNVSSHFRKGYPWGIPTDYGKVGIGYRPDIVGEKITSWHDVWRLAPKFSGQVVFIDLERDCMGSTLKYLGYSCNTTDQGQLDACKNALIQIKPHLQGFLNTNVGQGLVNGSTAIAMDWDYDVVVNKGKQPKIEWVAPTEGMHAYLEGFTAVKTTKNLPLVEEFMNFFLDPHQYADFVNTTGTAYVMPAASPFIQKAISTSPILLPTQSVIANVEFDHYLGATGTEEWANVWQEVKAA